MIDIRQYAHPLDQRLIDSIFSSAAGRGLVNVIMQHNLDDVCDYALESSYARLPEDNPLYQYMAEGQTMFGGVPVRSIYVTRHYEYEIAYNGYNHPAVIVPDVLVKRNDSDIMRARMLAAAAAVAMDHHKLEFLVWRLDTLGGSIPLPLVPEAVKGFLNEWYRCRYYTTDRAVWLATKDEELATRNILYGRIPFEMLDTFCFGINQYSFSGQVEELRNSRNLSATASRILQMLQKESWLPNRYIELTDFINNRR